MVQSLVHTVQTVLAEAVPPGSQASDGRLCIVVSRQHGAFKKAGAGIEDRLHCCLTDSFLAQVSLGPKRDQLEMELRARLPQPHVLVIQRKMTVRRYSANLSVI